MIERQGGRLMMTLPPGMAVRRLYTSDGVLFADTDAGTFRQVGGMMVLARSPRDTDSFTPPAA